MAAMTFFDKKLNRSKLLLLLLLLFFSLSSLYLQLRSSAFAIIESVYNIPYGICRQIQNNGK